MTQSMPVSKVSISAGNSSIVIEIQLPDLPFDHFEFISAFTTAKDLVSLLFRQSPVDFVSVSRYHYTTRISVSVSLI